MRLLGRRSGRLRSLLFLLLRLTVSAVLLAWLFRQLQGGWQQLEAVKPKSLLPAGIVFAASTVLGGLQWTLLLRHAGVEVGGGRLQQLYWIGLFFNNFLPSNVGGDIVKVADVAVNTGRLARPVAATLLDRMLGLLALSLLALFAGLSLGGASPAGVPWMWITAILLPVLALFAALLSRRSSSWIVMAVRRLAGGRSGARLAELVGQLQIYRVHPGFVIRLGLLALAVQSLRIFTHVLVARGMGLPLSGLEIREFFVLIPLLGMAIVMPISFNGLGLREFVATRLMPQIGIPAGSAFALELATYLVQVAISLVGGALFAWRLSRGKILSRGRVVHEPDAPEDASS